jgi:hypothetical protein
VSKLILALIIGVFLGAFTIELLGASRLKLFVRKLDDVWQRTKSVAHGFRREFDDAYSSAVRG